MKALLVLMVLHVSNAFVVLSSASEMNTSNCSWTNSQRYFTQHINMNILALSRNMLLNHLWKFETLAYGQFLQLCNNIASASSLQISNNELMQSTNDIIRLALQNVIHIYFDNTTDITQMDIYSSNIQVLIVTKRLNGKKKMIIKKKKKGRFTYIKRYEEEMINCVCYGFYLEMI
ncbi:hypothetical protein RFI_40217 [Reticulomyxa filosa]|uniref:Uncharacterized protein n=1 Tax=Reticulomyxa filosa TaxID=46433 RepID=X6L9B3_RETFI|nr:hypothetical protein RFI_40217 [Reticulomyxa filosa]|eukprot:ETN97314.1 hypothetical protein RFI_40217 [Reticulomyxa filosa]